MESDSGLAFLVAIWTVTGAVIALSRSNERSVGAGLVVAYVMILWLYNWPGAAIYLLPWYSNHELDVIKAGFEQSTYAIIAFGVGSVILAPVLGRVFRPNAPRATARVPDPRLPQIYVAIGLVCILGLFPIAGRVPTATALLSQGWNLLTVGLALACWQAWQAGRPVGFLLWLGAALCLPFFTLVHGGFLVHGTHAPTAVVAFIAGFFRPRWTVFVAAIVLGYVALSVHVSYMRDRPAIRDVVWDDSSVNARVARVYLTLSQLEWLDLYNADHLERIDDRLNQTYLIGAGVQYLDSGLAHFAYGETVWQAVVALIPRAIWPDKPVVAGSGTLVGQHTGVEYDETTSVAIDNVMEFYVNFGAAGVVLGSLILGIVVSIIDRVAGQNLRQGDWSGFMRWFLPGLALVHFGPLVELTASTAAAVVLALVLDRLLSGRRRARTSRPVRDGFRSSVAPPGPQWSPDGGMRVVRVARPRLAAGASGDYLPPPR